MRIVIGMQRSDISCVKVLYVNSYWQLCEDI